MAPAWVCDRCSKVFQRPLCWVKKHKNKFCGKDCKNRFHSKMMKINNPMKGKKRPDLIIRNKTMDVKGKNNPMYGVRRFGEDAANWKGGVSLFSDNLRSLKEYTNWRNIVFKRDDYTCRKCHQHKSGHLEAHHLKSLSGLITGFLQLYDQFSPIEDKETLLRLAIKYEPFWCIENGKTLCDECHKEVTDGKMVRSG